MAVVAAATATASFADASCTRDLTAMSEYLKVNDAGVATAFAAGLEPVEQGELASVLKDAEHATSAEQCLAALQTAAALYRRGHLAVQMHDPESALPPWEQASPPATIVRAPAGQVALIALPTFAGDAQQQIEQALRAGRSILRSRPIWILDVRGNEGGSDFAWKPLLRLFGATTIVSYGAEHLATPANVAANERVRQQLGASDPEADRFFAEAVARMRAAPEGSYVSLGGVPTGERFSLDFLPPAEHPPRLVAILTDGRCASSCEEFVLAARQSWRVKVFGQSTAGILDFSNLRPWPMPSGRYILWYATSRSKRLPEHAIDGWGIAPDIPLPDEHMVGTLALDLVRQIVEPPQAGSRKRGGERP